MRQQSQQNIYYMTIHLGHVYGLFDQAGERLSLRGYSPCGQVSGDGFTLQPFGMSTKRSDFESGLVYFGYRFYMPNLGRWLNRDPLQEQGGINLYAYVDGDPLGYVDPDGKQAFPIPYIPNRPTEDYYPQEVKDSIEKGEKKAKKKACDTAGYTQTVADMASTLFPPSRPLCVGVDVYSRLVKGVVCEK
ncbi:hypothetical protein BCT35_20785 [Vibrio lentus]|uniref:RHS repeat-associated core domain-containing protein n=1 Tax=Vibrio lentus TaxID=136468 RepID=UPI000CB00C23|nr:RHS repeat-associated core domain-containing protein [Vibrio lentus]PML47837.1 hypothetical protein BCT75_21940 [Vibrio lentus]PMN29360.1 hypothetical protein BCT35_20785 [Vibrio lentus]